MQLHNYIFDTVIPLAVGITGKNDRWTICGPFKRGADGPPVILIAAKSLDSWKRKWSSSLKRSSSSGVSGSGFKFSIDCKTSSGVIPVTVFIIEPPVQFGLFEIVLSLSNSNAGELKMVLETPKGILSPPVWPLYGFILDKGGLYMAKRGGARHGAPIMIFSGLSFVRFVLNSPSVKNGLRGELVEIQKNILLFERECFDVATRD